jgi:glutathione S-transferase
MPALVVSARVYVIALSNPSRAATAMLAHKRIEHRVVWLPPGPHPQLVRAAGFPGSTVPALELADGRRLQGTLVISRALDELVPEPPLFPRERDARRAVEEAERWGHSELQPLPRRIFRWALLRDPALRRWMAREIVRWPAPDLMAALARPMIRRLARASGAEDARVAADIERLPALLDHADRLIAGGTIGSPDPNAADFQILASVRVLLEFENFAHLNEGRPCAAAARRLYPRWEGPIPQFSEGSAGMVASSR